MDRADVVCIGSGITALAFGAILAGRAPRQRLLVLEKHTIPGGYATVFHRKKTRFDSSLHKLSGMGSEGNLRRILQELGLFKKLDWVASDVFFEAHLGERRFVLPSDYAGYKQALETAFPEEQVGLATFFSELETHGKNGYHQYQMLSGEYLPDMQQVRFAHKHLRKMTVATALRERVGSPLLRELLAAPSVYVGGFAEDLSYLYFLHALYATLVCGSVYLRGGSQRLSDALVECIRQAGGEVFMRTEVQRIVVDEELKVIGVATNRGSYATEKVFVNASPQYALQALFSPRPELEGVRRALDALTPSWSTTTLHVVVDQPPEALGIEASETMILDPLCLGVTRLECERAEARDLAERTLWAHGTLELTNYHKLDPSGGYAICINVLDTMSHWPLRGTREYHEKKQRAATCLLERVLHHKPALRGHILYQTVSSPHTYQRYTNNYAGAGYGGLVGTNVVAHTFHHRFPVRGVQFLSSWVAGSGYEAAFSFAEARAQRCARG